MTNHEISSESSVLDPRIYSVKGCNAEMQVSDICPHLLPTNLRFSNYDGFITIKVKILRSYYDDVN